MSLHSSYAVRRDLSAQNLLHNGREVLEAARRIYGVVPGRVKAIHDAKNNRHMQNHVQVWFPWLQQSSDKKLYLPWARVAVPDAGNKFPSGFKMTPNHAPISGGEPLKVGDEVLCAFEHGDPHQPYVLGALWNKQQNIPEPTTPADKGASGATCTCHSGGPKLKTPCLKPQSIAGGKGKNKIMFIKSRTGNLLVLDDDKGTIRLNDCTGNSCIQLEKEKILLLQRKGDLYFWAKKTISFDCETYQIHASSKIYYKADKDVSISAKGNVSNFLSKTTKCTAMKDFSITAKKEVGFRAKGSMTFMSMKGSTIVSSDGDLKIESKGMLSATGIGGITIASKAKVNIEGKAMLSIATPIKCQFLAKSTLTAKAAVIMLN